MHRRRGLAAPVALPQGASLSPLPVLRPPPSFCSMSVSHPNVCICHQMCVVRLLSGEEQAAAEQAAAAARPGNSGSTADASGSGGGSGGSRVAPAFGGAGVVEVVPPHDVLQPGLHETWLATGAKATGWRSFSRYLLLSGNMFSGTCLKETCLVERAGCMMETGAMPRHSSERPSIAPALLPHLRPPALPSPSPQQSTATVGHWPTCWQRASTSRQTRCSATPGRCCACWT